jgi:hypothetical protein
LLHPKWWVLHLLVIAACVAMVLLGRWQWSTAGHRHGDARNYAYAVQWWAFMVFTLVMWGRVIHDYLHPKPSEDPDVAVIQQAELALPPSPSTARATSSAPEPAVEVPAGAEAEERYLRYTPPITVPDDDDEERARFNAYLAGLNAAHGHAAQGKERS